MESTDTNNLPNESDNTNLNEATPATAPVLASDVSKDTGCMLSDAAERDDAISSTTPDKFVEQLDASTSNMMSLDDAGLDTESDADFFAAELSMTGVPTEKITENVEDIVQDLENLLGESNDSYRFGRESFDNSKLSETFDEVNSSNVEDLLQQSDLYQVEDTNIESMVPKCDLLPDNSIMTPGNVTDTNLSESIPVEAPVTTTEANIADVIGELKDIKEDESVTAVLNLVESTAGVTMELKDMVQEALPVEISEPVELSADTNTVSNYGNEIIEATSLLDTKTEESCGINPEQMINTECQINEKQEAKIEAVEEDSVLNVNIPDSNEAIMNIEEELPAQINLDQNLTSEEPQQDPVQLLDELVESTNIVDDSVSACVDDLMDTIKDLSDQMDSVVTQAPVEEEPKQYANEEETAPPEATQLDQEQIAPSEVMDLNNEADVLPEVKQREESKREAQEEAILPEQSDQEPVIPPEPMECQDEEQKNLDPIEVKQQEDLQEAEKEITLPEKPEEVSVSLAELQRDEEQASSSKSSVDVICVDSNLKEDSVEQAVTCMDVDLDLKEVESDVVCVDAKAIVDSAALENPDSISADVDLKEDNTLVDKADVDSNIVDDNASAEKAEVICLDADSKEDISSTEKDEVICLDTNIIDDNASAEKPEVICVNADRSEDVTSTREDDMICVDANIIDDNASADVLPMNIATDDTEEKSSAKSTECVQPLTVEVEDPDFSEQSIIEIPDDDEDEEDERTDKVEEVQEVEEVMEVAKVPLNNISVADESQVSRAPLKMTIAKHKSENTHSILKIYDPNEAHSTEGHIPKLIIKSTPSSTTDDYQDELLVSEEPVIPRITIKPVLIPSESQHSPKLTIKPIKPPSNEDLGSPRTKSSTGSPRITIKPVLKPEALSPLKISLRPYPKLDELPSSPKLNIKPIVKPMDDEMHHSPKITIKPIIKPPDELQSYSEERHSPRITIKPIIKPETESENTPGPRITIKPIIKPQGSDDNDEVPVQQPFKLNIKPVVRPAESSLSPKITIKPVPKPPQVEAEPVELIDFEEQIKQERIVLKIAKNSKKENEKVKKIKVKLSKQGGTAHIVSSQKRPSSDNIEHESKYFRAESTSDLTISLVSNTTTMSSTPDITITRVESTSMKMEGGGSRHDDSSCEAIAPITIESLPSPNVSSSLRMEDLPDPLADIPVFEITLETAAAMSSAPHKAMQNSGASALGTPPAPRKRGRPRKVPLEVREEFKDPKEEEVPPVVVVEESTRPKRSCRGASARTTLGIKPRKPRAPKSDKGGKRTVATRATSAKKSKERKPAKSKQPPKEPPPMVKEPEFKEFEPKDAEFKQVPVPAETPNREVVIYEEETRMSAENTSRAQTPAKQVLASSAEVIIEESQSSIQSNTTTESGEKLQKVRKGPRLEVHQEPEGEVISADKLAEYSWGGGGPYMLQEQVAQFLGIKSFKRKYPGIQRRPVDMQERDFIRESCLASEAMCDMGLTAVKSEDILDIMYTDFQNKYEEYCKHQRDRQAKDVSNKQKALSLAASQEKTKLDIVEQAVQSAFQWNASFNKARREQRRACMDLQTFTVHFPKGKMKQVNKPPIGHYPLALVPGQFTDYYKKYSPFELSNLPLNTIGCNIGSNIGSVNHDTEESQSDASGSDSDSSSSDSDSSCSGSSGIEDCKMCSPAASSKKLLIH